MATAYDTWLEGNCGIDAAEEAREEAIAERTKTLVAQRTADLEHVRAGIEDLMLLERADQLERALARFYVAFDAAQTDAGMAEAARELFRTLSPTVLQRIREDAETDAAAEYDRLQADMAEARAEARALAREYA
jgi:hypothetical protein